MNPKIPEPAAALLDFISKFESAGNYLAFYGHAKSLAALPPTLSAVLAWQEEYVKQGHPSSAIGRYQFMPKTLRGLMQEYSILGTEAFTTDLQDELGFYLLQRRGYDSWVAGKTPDATFADHLSQEWASLPYQTGKSYYDGDGLNHASVSRNEFLAALVKAKSSPVQPGSDSTSQAAKGTPMVNATPAATTAKHTSGPNLLAGMENILGGIVTNIESAVKTVVSPNNNVNSGGIFSSISQAQLAVQEIKNVISDIQGGKWQNVPEDVITILKTVFSILSDFGINVPGVTSIIAMLPDLAAVQTPAGGTAS